MRPLEITLHWRIFPKRLALTFMKRIEQIRPRRLGNIWGFTGGYFGGNVYDVDWISPALLIPSGGYREVMIRLVYETR